MATLLQDNFDRANSTNVVGSPQIGPAPVVQVGTAGISSNQLYASVQPMSVTWNLGTPNVELSAVGNVMNQWLYLILGFVSTTDYYAVTFLQTNPVSLIKVSPGGGMTLCSSSIKIPTALNGTVCKAHYRDGIVRAYVDDVLVFRWQLDAPITGNLHGIRMFSTTVRADNLLGVDAPVITEPDRPGEVVQEPKVSASVPLLSAFVYRGRDTKTQDQTAGA